MPVGKFTITMWDRLKWAKAAARETMHMVKPMITTDKKKKANKLKCRTKTFEEWFPIIIGLVVMTNNLLL